ncbi:hypothetical protein [Dokdonella soli]|uniref:PEP-CTERM sorting domain-containing protein n=1 Tax=Dokdonella soli TaxID=529810 RepID=A0ABP3TK08_9GAMM
MLRLYTITLVLALVTLSALAASARAQSGGGPYLIDPAVIAGGGATLSGGQFRLSGTIGQPATSILSASTYRLYDGFWAAASPSSDLIFANGFDP